ncbi:MAG TPA: hypothetical protein VM911_19600 [Pyrinomonadaceae bacterium]|jgi:hypothetical protein|nr:hypothetical protein [Pyrinomonadaceae bacterium]
MTKKISSRLLAATFTFIIGLSASTLWNGFRRTQSPCEFASGSTDPGRRFVTLRGMLYGSPDGKLTFNESECSGAWMAVEFHQTFRADAETRQFIERLNALAGGDRMSRAEVIVTGTLTDQHLRGDEPPFAVSVITLERTSSISLISLVSN